MNTRFKSSVAALAALFLSACTTTSNKVEESYPPFFDLVSWSSVENSSDSSWTEALLAFNQSCGVKSFSANPVWSNVCQKAQSFDSSRAKEFFTTEFSPWLVSLSRSDEKEYAGLMTGYFEPQLTGSRTRQGPFQYPILGVPDDLLIIDLSEVYPELKSTRYRGKLEGRRVVPYDKRGVIQDREDLEKWAIAWVDNPVAAFFLHIQGSGRILLADGSYMRVGYADQNGWKYHSVGNWLVKNGALKRHELSMQNIKAWARQNPDKVKEMMAQNPSYIFFEERLGDVASGPIGAQGVPLTPKASVAVDTKYWTLGTPFIVSVKQDKPAMFFTRPVIAQDTGGAIKGELRFDYFWGFGDKAGEAAGRQKSNVKAWVLIPNGFTPKDIQ